MKRFVFVISAVGLAMLLTACVVPVAPAGGVYGQPIAVAPVAPPPARVEVIPVIPFIGAIWIDGFWGWGGGRHVWVGGHWTQPRPGMQWQPHQWTRDGDHWRLNSGGWHQRR